MDAAAPAKLLHRREEVLVHLAREPGRVGQQIARELPHRGRDVAALDRRCLGAHVEATVPPPQRFT
jgi:hypothetical protein